MAARRARCQAAGIPNHAVFQTKPQLAQGMLARATANQIPAKWVVADTVYSSDELRLWLQTQGYWYVLAIPCTYSVWEGGQQVSVAALMETVVA